MIIYYDGVCKLCFGFVSVVYRYTKPGTFIFQPLQGSEFDKPEIPFNSVIVKTAEGKLLFKSDAVRYILNYMTWPFRTLNIFISIFPEKIQNYIYDYIARNRYNWFGKNKSCQIIQ